VVGTDFAGYDIECADEEEGDENCAKAFRAQDLCDGWLWRCYPRDAGFVLRRAEWDERRVFQEVWKI